MAVRPEEVVSDMGQVERSRWEWVWWAVLILDVVVIVLAVAFCLWWVL